MSSAFCSQLVGGAYKRMGLLPPEPAASSYFPRDFSGLSSARLPLTEGNRLGKELKIRFENSPAFHSRTSLLSSVRMTTSSSIRVKPVLLAFVFFISFVFHSFVVE